MSSVYTSWKTHLANFQPDAGYEQNFCSLSQSRSTHKDRKVTLFCFVREEVGEDTMGMGGDISTATLPTEFPTGCSGALRLCFHTASKIGLPVFRCPSWMPITQLSLPVINCLNQPVWVYHGNTKATDSQVSRGEPPAGLPGTCCLVLLTPRALEKHHPNIPLDPSSRTFYPQAHKLLSVLHTKMLSVCTGN